MIDLNRCLKCNRKLHTFAKVEQWLIEVAAKYNNNINQVTLFPFYLSRSRRCRCGLDHRIYADGTREYSELFFIPNMIMVKGFPDPKNNYTLIDLNPKTYGAYVYFNSSDAKKIDTYIDPNTLLDVGYLQKLIMLL